MMPNIVYCCILLSLVSANVEDYVQLIFHENKTIFRTNNFINGKVKYNNTNYQRLKVKNVYLELVGNIVYITKQSAHNNKIKSNVHRMNFFKKKIYLKSSETDDFEWPFKILLDTCMPPSFGSQSRDGPYIEYVIHVVLIRSEWYRFNIRKQQMIHIRKAPVSHQETQNERRKQKWDKIEVGVNLHNKSVVAGQNVSFDVEIHNPKQLLINHIQVVLSQEMFLQPISGISTNILTQIFNTSNDCRETEYLQTFQLHVPHYILPSFKYEFIRKRIERWMSVTYAIHLEVKIDSSFRTFRLKVPLILTAPLEIY